MIAISVSISQVFQALVTYVWGTTHQRSCLWVQLLGCRSVDVLHSNIFDSQVGLQGGALMLEMLPWKTYFYEVATVLTGNSLHSVSLL